MNKAKDIGPSDTSFDLDQLVSQDLIIYLKEEYAYDCTSKIKVIINSSNPGNYSITKGKLKITKYG